MTIVESMGPTGLIDYLAAPQVAEASCDNRLQPFLPDPFVCRREHLASVLNPLGRDTASVAV